MAPIFRALADPGRRVLLDRLFERDGQTLGELCAALPDMTRFGVMKHLGVLEEADLVTTRRSAARSATSSTRCRSVSPTIAGSASSPSRSSGAMSILKTKLEAPMDPVDHVYSVYIKASPERVWRAITDGDDTVRYYFGTRVASDWEPGAAIPTPIRTARSPPTARCSRSSQAERGDVVPSSLVARDRGRGPGPDDLGGRARRRAGEPTRLVVTTAMVPGSRIDDRVHRRHRAHRVRPQDAPRNGRAAGGRLSGAERAGRSRGGRPPLSFPG